MTHKTSVKQIFVNEIQPNQEEAFLEWMAAVHAAESKFPGFLSTHTQPPSKKGGRNWISHVEFDSVENLERWLASKERFRVLEEGKLLLQSLELYRVISPFEGWFEKNATALPVIKQTLVVLLILFPLVMLEILYFLPCISHLNLSLQTFIGNAISVTLISWPMMPLAIYYLDWWLFPKGKKKARTNALGFLLIFALYAVEVLVFYVIVT